MTASGAACALSRAHAVAVLALCLGCTRAPVRPAAVAAADPGLGKVEQGLQASEWLQRDARLAQAAGASALRVVAAEPAVAGDHVGGLMTIPAADCALFIARSTPSIDDIDLFAYGEDGLDLGRDEAPDNTPALLVCPPHPARVYIGSRVAAGHGLVAVGAQLVKPKDAARVRQAAGVGDGPGLSAAGERSFPNLGTRINDHRATIGGSWEEIRRVALPVEPRLATRLSAIVDGDRCLDIWITPAPEVSHLDVAVEDSLGRVLGRALASGRDRALILCSPVDTSVTITVRPQAGRGTVAAILSRSRPGTEAEIVATRLIFRTAPLGTLVQEREDHAARLERLGYESGKLAKTGTLTLGQRLSVPLTLPTGCVRIDVLGGAPLRGLDVWLWSQDGKLLASDQGGAPATLFACTGGQRARLDLEPLAQPGPFAVELRPEPDAPVVLRDQPLAASRLLTRLLSRGSLRQARQLGSAQVVRVSATEIASQVEQVPFGRCVEVVLALGIGASGAELRLVDEETGQELALARGTDSVAARACALERSATLRARIEMRCLAGETQALFARRMLAPKQ